MGDDKSDFVASERLVAYFLRAVFMRTLDPIKSSGSIWPKAVAKKTVHEAGEPTGLNRLSSSDRHVHEITVKRRKKMFLIAFSCLNFIYNWRSLIKMSIVLEIYEIH